MEHEIFGIFPTPVMKFKFPREFTQTEISFFVKKAREDIVRNVGNTGSGNNYILECAEMVEIKHFCLAALQDYYMQIMSPKKPEDASLYITQSWLNYSKPEEFHHAHYHPNSIVSGVLYINADKDLDNISFSRPDLHREVEVVCNNNIFNSYETTFGIARYQLLLFPSKLMHSVSKTKSREVRISLSFNSFFKGTIGEQSALSRLELP